MRWTALVALLLAAAARAGDLPHVALFYGAAAPLAELRAFDIVVVDPDHGYDPRAYNSASSELFAYVSLGEAHPSRSWFASIPPAWKAGANTAWGSVVIDQARAEWAEFVAERIVAPLWARGYRGLFLDTLDSYRLARGTDPAAQQQGLVRLIRELRRRFPGLRLIANRGFELLPQIRDELAAVAAESLFRGWDAAAGHYVEVPAKDREWLLEQLRQVRAEHGLPAIAIDYVDPRERDLARTTADRIAALGIVPWVADGGLNTLGVGRREAMPRRVLVLYDGREARAINYTNAHRYVAMPLNHLGYVPEYADVNQPLPQAALAPRYAGIVTWFTGGLLPGPGAATVKWLRRQIEAGLRVAVFGDLGFAATDTNLAALGLRLSEKGAAGRLKVAARDPIVGLEAEPVPDRRNLVPLRLSGAADRSLLVLEDAAGQRFDAAAITGWGGFVLDPFAVVEPPGTDDQARWVVDPFVFLERALRLPAMPVPDVTTENGRRLLLAHIDGDGFPSRAELPGAPLAAEVLLREVLGKYRVPHTVSVIEAEIAPDGLHPELAAQMEDLARRMFALPHVEVASHTYSHPFHWDKAEAGADPDDPDAYYALRVPDYTVAIEREIVGSLDYVRRRLAPSGKPVEVLLWSGDAAPGERSLRTAQAAGALNMNGGNTVIIRSNPSLTAVSALGIEKGGVFQTYAPMMNENVYTNLWRGPFYGYERAIETMELTEKPRRLKPIDIYYHTYSASKRASLKALHKVYGWALAQPVHPVFGSEYIRKALDFNRIAVARDRASGAWIVRGDGALRTLRVPGALGVPDIGGSTAVAGYSPAAGGERYVHLAAGSAELRLRPAGAPQPHLAEANGRIADWQSRPGGWRLGLRAQVPLEFALGAVDGCSVTADGRPLPAGRRSGDLTHYRLPHAAQALQVSCGQP
jgi:uncharacterized protein (TIGR01370 family)